MDPVNIPAKFEVRSFTRSWDNRDTQKIGTVPGYAHTPFSPKTLRAFVRMDPVNIPAKFEVRSFTRSWDDMGYSKSWGSPWIRPRSIFSQNFKGLLFGYSISLSTLSQKSESVAENGETTAKFGDSRTFLRQCGQAYRIFDLTFGSADNLSPLLS